jgi:hypothetical protein
MLTPGVRETGTRDRLIYSRVQDGAYGARAQPVSMNTNWRRTTILGRNYARIAPSPRRSYVMLKIVNHVSPSHLLLILTHMNGITRETRRRHAQLFYTAMTTGHSLVEHATTLLTSLHATSCKVNGVHSVHTRDCVKTPTVGCALKTHSLHTKRRRFGAPSTKTHLARCSREVQEPNVGLIAQYAFIPSKLSYRT